nr:RDD family protein [Thioalkalivibrio sp.]
MPGTDLTPGPVGLLRRLAAMIYDGLLLLAIWMVLGLVFVLVEEVTGYTLIPLQFVVNLLAAWFFFAWFWTRTGQTLGMQAWNIQLRDEAGGPANPKQATLRYLVALAQWLVVLLGIYLAREHGALVTAGATALLVVGLGLSQAHPRRAMLHDWLSGTELVRVTRQAGPQKGP